MIGRSFASCAYILRVERRAAAPCRRPRAPRRAPGPRRDCEYFGVVQRAAGVQELIKVAVRVDAAGPRRQERLEVAARGRVQRRGVFRGGDLHVEPGLGGHRLDDLADLAQVRVVRHRQVHHHRRLHPRLLQQRLGRVHVPRLRLELGDVHRAAPAGCPAPPARTGRYRRPAAAPRGRSSARTPAARARPGRSACSPAARSPTLNSMVWNPSASIIASFSLRVLLHRVHIGRHDVFDQFGAARPAGWRAGSSCRG